MWVYVFINLLDVACGADPAEEWVENLFRMLKNNCLNGFDSQQHSFRLVVTYESTISNSARMALVSTPKVVPRSRHKRFRLNFSYKKPVSKELYCYHVSENGQNRWPVTVSWSYIYIYTRKTNFQRVVRQTKSRPSAGENRPQSMICVFF